MNIRMTLCAATLAAAAALTAACMSPRAHTGTEPQRATNVDAGSAGGATTAATPPKGQGGTRPPSAAPTSPRLTAPRTVRPPTVSPTRRPVGHSVLSECRKATGLTVRPGSTDASSGHRREVLVFTNTSRHTCVLIGYPGVDALDSAGHAVAHARRTLRGFEGGIAGPRPARVTLAPGKAASAIVEALGFIPATGDRCTVYAGLLVTAPDDARSTRVAWPDTDSCADLEVHPVQPGTNP